MAAERKTYPKEFWNIYRSVKKAHPEYSQKRKRTDAKNANAKRYATVEA